MSELTREQPAKASLLAMFEENASLRAQLAACEKKVAKYEDRLGLVYAYEGHDMTRVELSEKQKETFPDTVTCLEGDVELRDKYIKDLKTELTALHQQLQAREETILKLRQDDLGKCTSYLWDEISALFPKLGVESAYVTDLSTVGDFPENGGMDEEKPLWQAAIDAQRATITRLEGALKAIYQLDWVAMLRLMPDGIEHRASNYNSAEAFSTEGSYEEDARYQYPAREKMISAVAKHALTPKEGRDDE